MVIFYTSDQAQYKQSTKEVSKVAPFGVRSINETILTRGKADTPRLSACRE